MAVPKCFFCERTDARWCSLCKEYLCPEHEKDYLARMGQAAAHPVDTAKKVFDWARGK